MRLVTPYAPTTFLKPCIVIDTVYTEGGEKETAVLFNEALNANHALAFHSDEVRKVEEITGHKKVSEWSVVKKHESEQEAIDYHLSLAKQLHNGGSNESWEQGMDIYLELYDKYCPQEMRDRFDAKKEAAC
jgi:hypothetical protein